MGYQVCEKPHIEYEVDSRVVGGEEVRWTGERFSLNVMIRPFGHR